MTLGQVPSGSRFRQPATGLTGRILRVGPGCVDVQLDRYRDVLIHGEVKARSGERTSWSLATDVEPLEEGR